MDKKARSRPMNAIVERMLAFGEFEIIIFGDDCILNKPVTEWPACECLLSWHSEGFSLAKVTSLPVNISDGRCFTAASLAREPRYVARGIHYHLLQRQ